MTDSLRKLSEKGHLLGLEMQWCVECLGIVGCTQVETGVEVDSEYLDPVLNDVSNAPAVMVLLKAIEAKGFTVEIGWSYEETTECSLITSEAPSGVLYQTTDRRSTRTPCERHVTIVKVGKGSHVAATGSHKTSITEAVVKAALALCEDLEP